MYKISQYSYNQAKKLGVKIYPSKYKNKKIDVYDFNNNFIFSIGDIRYKDFQIYLKEKGKQYAENRRRLYHIRHNKDEKKLDSRGYYASIILW